jgi:hypothetical protein
LVQAEGSRHSYDVLGGIFEILKCEANVVESIEPFVQRSVLYIAQAQTNSTPKTSNSGFQEGQEWSIEYFFAKRRETADTHIDAIYHGFWSLGFKAGCCR